MPRKEVQISRKSYGAKTLDRDAIREELSEQSRLSFCVEGIRVERGEWDRINQRAVRYRKRLAAV